MIRVAIIDDHPAVRAGLAAVIAREPGFVVAATADGPREALAKLRGDDVDVAIVDYRMRDGDGIALARRLRRKGVCPSVIYTAFADDHLSAVAVAAGVGAVVSKGAPPDELFDGLRMVARGARVGEIDPAARQKLFEAIEPTDFALLSMCIDGASEEEMASVLGKSKDHVAGRVDRMLMTIHPRTRR